MCLKNSASNNVTTGHAKKVKDFKQAVDKSAAEGFFSLTANRYLMKSAQ